MATQAVHVLPADQGTRATGGALDHEALVWALRALGQYFRIPVDEKLVTGQLSPPYDFDTLVRAAESLGLRAGWKALPAARLKTLPAPFVVVLAPMGSAPQRSGTGVERASPAPLDAQAAGWRLALVVRIDAVLGLKVFEHLLRLPPRYFEQRPTGMLVAFTMFASRLSQPMLKLVGLWQEFQQAGIAVKRLGDVMNAPQEPYSTIPSRERARKGKIDIDNLAFRYTENLPYLYQHLSIKIEPGQCIALMGPSGCGKSTLAKLLQGFYQPTEGSIKLDGHDIRHLSANELRSSFGVVPQETTLFSGAIYDNLVLGNAQASFDDVVTACKAAGIHDTLEALPQGYQTPIGEHGAGLSGGQKQRIAIARALLKRPPILIFDEATSNLDDETANAFGETVNQLRGKVTILLIAHKLPASIRDLQTLSLAAQASR